MMERRVDLSDPMDVLAFVLATAGDEITVYPSEGYFYFEFQNGPEQVRGNIRFDSDDAPVGKLNFGYHVPTTYGQDTVDHFSVLGRAEGVGLEPVSPFEYRLVFRDRTTRVKIYDAHEELAGPKPLGPDESYVGPVFDESGIRFHLLFDDKENAFFFVLNEEMPAADTYSVHPASNRIEVGNRTGYIFYNDSAQNRRILVGVSYPNIRSNSYFDGPFDQLPDRFVTGERMRDLMERAYPHLRGHIGPRGVYLDSEYMRAMVAPYRRYEMLSEAGILTDCDSYAQDNHALTRCLKSFAGQ